MKNWLALSGDKRLKVKDDWLAMMHEEEDVQEKSMTCFWSSMMGRKKRDVAKRVQAEVRNVESKQVPQTSQVQSSPLRNFMLNFKPSKATTTMTPASSRPLPPTNRSPVFVMASLAVSSLNRNVQTNVTEATSQPFSSANGAFLGPFLTNDLLPTPSSVLENIILEQFADTPSDLDLDECVIVVDDTGLDSCWSSKSSKEQEQENHSITCPICLEAFEKGDVVVKLPCPCKHCAYHRDCIEPWLTKNNTCPMCRTVLDEKQT